jgi:hypothetical protein
MTAFRTAFVALALAGALPATAGAEPSPGPGPSTLEAATNVYFGSLRTGDRHAFFRSVANEFRAILPDGSQLGSGDFIGGIQAHQLNRSTPVQFVRVAGTTVAQATATETVDVHSWDNVQNGTPISLERNAATHVLTFKRIDDGTWLVTEDHITSALTVF